MSRKIRVFFILVVFSLGFIATLISGFYTQNLGKLGVSITGYGLPLCWLKTFTIVYPGEPTHYEFYLGSFLLDMSFWSLVVLTLLAVLVYRRKHTF